MKSHSDLGHYKLIAPGSTKCKRMVKDDFTEKEIKITYKMANGNIKLALEIFDDKLHTRMYIQLCAFMTAWVFSMLVLSMGLHYFYKMIV